MHSPKVLCILSTWLIALSTANVMSDPPSNMKPQNSPGGMDLNVIRDLSNEIMNIYMTAIRERADWIKVLLYDVKNESNIRKTKVGCEKENDYCLYKLDFLVDDKSREHLNHFKTHRSEILSRLRRRALLMDEHDSNSNLLITLNPEPAVVEELEYANVKKTSDHLQVEERVKVHAEHYIEHATLTRDCTDMEKETSCRNPHLCEYVFLLSQIICKCKPGFRGHACDVFDLSATLEKLKPYQTQLIVFEHLQQDEADEIRSVLQASARYTLNAYVEQRSQQMIW